MSLVSFITLTAVPRIAQARRGFGSEKPCKFSKAFGLGMAGGLASIKPRVFPEDPLCAARSRSRPVRENQLDKAGNPVGRKSLIADFVLSGLLPSRCVPQEPSLPTVIPSAASRCFFSPPRSCEAVGLRAEESLFVSVLFPFLPRCPRRSANENNMKGKN